MSAYSDVSPALSQPAVRPAAEKCVCQTRDRLIKLNGNVGMISKKETKTSLIQ